MRFSRADSGMDANGAELRLELSLGRKPCDAGGKKSRMVFKDWPMSFENPMPEESFEAAAVLTGHEFSSFGFSSPGSSSTSASSLLLPAFSTKGESSSSNSSSASKDNTLPNWAFKKCKPGLKKQSKKGGISSRKEGKKAGCGGQMMQAVSTRSAEGKRICGFLHGFGSNNEVTIICGCHGSLFSAAGFVRHAGGPETLHPLRQIIMLPS